MIMGKWQEGDYIAFKAGRRWYIARVIGERPMCSESTEMMVVEPSGRVAGLRWPDHCTTLLERVPTDAKPSCESYFHEHPFDPTGRGRAKCIDCGDELQPR